MLAGAAPRAFRSGRGIVRAPAGARSGGRVAAHEGEYHDALHCKRNEFWLVLMEIFGGLAPEGGKLFRLYTQRARKAGVDRTEYVTTDSATQGAHKFAPHWAQLLSASVVEGDAARSLRAVDKARSEAMHRAPVSPRPPPPRVARRP